MACITDETDETTVVIHPAWPALIVLHEAERQQGAFARELREDAERIAASVPWGWAATMDGAP